MRVVPVLTSLLTVRLRINIGNIYFEQKKYLQAIKMYRMALDQIPNAQMDLRCVLLAKHPSLT